MYISWDPPLVLHIANLLTDSKLRGVDRVDILPKDIIPNYFQFTIGDILQLWKRIWSKRYLPSTKVCFQSLDSNSRILKIARSQGGVGTWTVKSDLVCTPPPLVSSCDWLRMGHMISYPLYSYPSPYLPIPVEAIYWLWLELRFAKRIDFEANGWLFPI